MTTQEPEKIAISKLKYASGEEIKLGDEVCLGTKVGQVKALLAEKLYAEGYEIYSCLEKGFIVETSIGDICLPCPDEDTVFISRENNGNDES